MVRWLFLAVWSSALAAGPAPAPVPASTPASPAARDVLLSKIGAKYGPVDVMRANFVQITKSPYGEEKVQGTVVLKRPGQMRWNFADGRQFVSDGQTLWIYTPADKQVLRIQNFGEQAATADRVLQSMHKLAELFEVTLISSDEKAGHVLALATKPGEQAQFQKLQLALDAGLLLDKVTLTDAFGTNTVLDFDGLALGGTAAASDFQFVVPPGVSVVDSGG
jgi:outer membrane lipoprotein carrier protein